MVDGPDRPVVQIGDSLWHSNNTIHGTIALFAQPKSNKNQNNTEIGVVKITESATRSHQNIQHKDFYAITAGHCVEDGHEYTVKKGDKSFLLGKCILKFDSKSTAGESVDVGVIRVYDHCIRKVHIDPYFSKGKDVKYDVKVVDAAEGDCVLLYKAEKMNTELVVCGARKDVSCKGFTFKAVDELENEAENRGSGIIPGDSGTAVWQDAGPGKAEVYGMVVACVYYGPTGAQNIKQPNNNAGMHVQQSCVETDDNEDDLAANPTTTGLAISMQRTLDHIAQQLHIQLVPFQAQQTMPVPVTHGVKRAAVEVDT